MRMIDSDAVSLTMEPRLLIEALRVGHAAAAKPDVKRMLMSQGQEDSCLVWGGWREGEAIVVKVASVFPGNQADGLHPNIHSIVLVMDGESGRPLALIHGEQFTRMKTAADSALGLDLLGRQEVDTLAVLGAGAQAETHIKFLLAVRPSIRSVRIWNRSVDRAVALADRLNASGVEFVATASAQDAVEQADVISCLTATSTPVLLGAWLLPGAHVDLVGGYTPAMREADDDVILRGRLFADSRQFTKTLCGDYSQPLAQGLISHEKIEADLFDLCKAPALYKRRPDDVTVFKNGGGGHLDLFAAQAFVKT